MSVPEELADVTIHDNALKELDKWTKKKKYNPKKISNLEEDFKNKLKKCYDLGYFLHSSYGGVTLWNLEKEFKEFLEISKEEIEIKKNTKKNLGLNKEQSFL